MTYDFFSPFGGLNPMNNEFYNGLNTMSDNYVTGDNIYLRELQNFFFETLGMMSITHYGAIGDGRRDNYGPLQVAIDDALRRGLSYIYVPFGKYIYTGELVGRVDPDTGVTRVVFVGNPKAKIINIRTGEEIPIEQFGVPTSSNYYTKQEIDMLLEAKQDRLIAGEGITIDGNVISAVAGGDGTLFASCPFPTEWENSFEQQTDTGTNGYGTWTISTNLRVVTEHDWYISKMFDGDTSTYLYLSHATASYPSEVEIDLPDGVSISPAIFYFKERGLEIRQMYPARNPILYGYNASTSEWEEIATINEEITSMVATPIELTKEISTSKYFTKFKLGNIYNMGSGEKAIYEIQIRVGKIKVANNEEEIDEPLGGE